MIVLHELLANAGFCHRPFVIAFEEKSALIAEDVRLENQQPGQSYGSYLQRVHRLDGFRILSLLAVAVDTPHSCYSSWRLRYAPLPGQYVAVPVSDFLRTRHH